MSWALLAGALISAALVPGQAASAALAAPEPGAPASPPVLSAATRAGAMAVAEQSGRATEVTGLTTDRRLVMADPATGTFTETLNPWPVRAQVDGSWVPVDATLTPVGDHLAPRASSVGLSISRGGLGDLARLIDGDHAFAFRWPTALPTPALHGDRAVFADVRPGIDLVVAATSTGFGEFLVVHDRRAAQDPWLHHVTLAVDAPGQTLRKVGDQLKAYDASGSLTFASEPVRMWDSAARTAPVRFRVSRTSVELSPDRAMLTSRRTRFPIVIDPSVSGLRKRFASVNSSGDKGAYTTTNKDETPWIGLSKKSGTPHGGLVQRISYGFEVPPDAMQKGVTILSAKFRHLQVQSTETGTDCLKQTNGPAINLWETHDFSDNFDWDHQPGTILKLSNSHFVVGNVKECNASGYPNKPAVQEWDALAGVLEHKADQDDILTLRINEEYDDNDDPSATVRASGTRYYQNSLNYPALVIEDNTAPQAPAATTVSPSVVYQGETYVSSSTPLLRTTVRDENLTQDVTASFSLTPAGGTATTYSAAPVRGPGTTGATASTAAGQVSVVDGKRYAVTVKANDGVVDSTPGPSTAFTVDTTRPGVPVVTGAPTQTLTSGTPVTLTIDAPEPDVSSYAYGLNTSDPQTRVSPTALGAPVTVTLTPTQFGPNFVAVRSYDRAGNTSSSVLKVPLKVDGTLPSNRYRLDWSGTDTRTDTAPGSSVKQIPMPDGSTFAMGRDRYASDGTTTLDCKDRALSVSATSVVRSVTSAAPYPLDTSQAFTVSTWLKPDSLTGTATGSGDESYAVSMPASSTATALSLGFRKDPTSGQTYWLFTVTGPDGRVRVEDTGNRTAALVKAGQWTHLSGVFDPVAQTASLYVDGARVAQLTGVTFTPLTASQLEFGGGPLGTASLQWNGAVDEVLLYQGALPAAAINAQRNERRSAVAC